MSEHSHLSADLGHDEFEREVRGYSRRQVEETLAGLRLGMRTVEEGKRDLEVRLSQALDDNERIKLELSAARSSERPPHEEISERIGQILKLADDEAKSQRKRADDEIAKLRADAEAETTKLRTDAKADTDKSRAEAQEQAERMLSAAQEQAESTVANAKSEAEKTRKSATAEAQQVVADATKQSETAVATAKAQAKQQLDEATARATAIHDGAERRLNLLMSRHTEAIRRLTEIRDVVTTLVAGETDRGSLEDEVARSVASAVAEAKQSVRGGAEGRHAGVPAQGGPAQNGPAQNGPAQNAPAQGEGLAQAAGQRPGGLPAQQQAGPAQHGNGNQRGNGNGNSGQPGPDASRGRPAEHDDNASGIPVVRD
jgi:F0F1-type ATP synthase membrane subunit b/b'